MALTQQVEGGDMQKEGNGNGLLEGEQNEDENGVANDREGFQGQQRMSRGKSDGNGQAIDGERQGYGEQEFERFSQRQQWPQLIPSSEFQDEKTVQGDGKGAQRSNQGSNRSLPLSSDQHQKQSQQNEEQLQNKVHHSDQYAREVRQLERYLVVAYYSYVVDVRSEGGGIFDKQRVFKQALMDLRLFLRFYKDFGLQAMLKVSQVINVFKKEAVNHLWVDVDIFVGICKELVRVKYVQKDWQLVVVENEDQLTQRAKTILRLFDKEKVRRHLKCQNRQLWQYIMALYGRRRQQKVERRYENRQQLVGRFIERNFDLQVPRWLEKKEIDLEGRVKSRVKMEGKQSKRDEKTISSSIERLRTKSEKSIIGLRRMIDGDEQVKGLISGKSQVRKEKSIKPELLQVSKQPQNKQLLAKSQHKSAISIKRQIQRCLNGSGYKMEQNEKDTLLKELNITGEEPFLELYFRKEKKPNYLNVGIGRGDKKNNGDWEMLKKGQINKEYSIMKNKREKSSPTLLPKLSSSPKLNLFQKTQKNELLDIDSKKRKFNNIRSQPSQSLQSQSLSKNRVYSMKKMKTVKGQILGDLQGSISGDLKSISGDSKEKKKLVNGNADKMGRVDRRVYEYLARNRQVSESMALFNSKLVKQGQIKINKTPSGLMNSKIRHSPHKDRKGLVDSSQRAKAVGQSRKGLYSLGEGALG